MADQKNSNQVVRELIWLDVKEPGPSSLNVRELRGRNVNEELNTLHKTATQGRICVHSAVQNLEKKYLPTTAN